MRTAAAPVVGLLAALMVLLVPLGGGRLPETGAQAGTGSGTEDAHYEFTVLSGLGTQHNSNSAAGGTRTARAAS